MSPSARVIRRIASWLALLGAGLAAWAGLACLGWVPSWSLSSRPPTLRATLDEGRAGPASCSVAFSPDGTTLATAKAGQIELWDVVPGQTRTTLKVDAGWISSVVFSPDGKSLAVGLGGQGKDVAIQLWDANTREQKATFKGDGVRLRSLAFSPDGKVLAAGGVDETLRVWDVGSRKNTTTIKAWGIVSVAFSPDGKTLASASMDGTVKLWDMTSGKKDPDWTWVIGPWGEASSVAFSPDGKSLAAGGATELHSFGEGFGDIELWDLASRQDKTRFRGGHSQNIESVAFSPDGKTLASGSWDGKVQLWDTSKGKLKATVDGNDQEVCVAFSPDGKILASWGFSGRIKLWDMPNTM
jgi:WD40 repeat protein